MALALAFARTATAQDQDNSSKNPATSAPQEEVEANPGRPTVATPATLTPVGYLQFESGVLGAWNSPGVTSQFSVDEVIKFSVNRWIQFLASSQPYAHTLSRGQVSNFAGDTALGVQAVVYHGEAAKPTLAVSYFGRVYEGDAPNLDVGGFRNSVLLMASADVKGFHYDTNCFFNEQVDGAVRRGQFGQTLSVSHSIGSKFGISGEIWHFTQPFLRGNTVGNLWAVNYDPRTNLVFDVGFNRGLTSTSTRWEAFGGFTYLLPHKLHLH
jgi:hypothetical protein